MKKFKLILTAVTVLIGSATFAQVTDVATLEVQLHDIQSIVVASTQETVHLDVTTAAEYANGVSQNQTAHLTVVSTSKYDITAKASQDLTHTNATDIIPVTNITLTAAPASNEPGDGAVAPVALSKAASVLLVDNGSADLDANYDVNYDLSGGAHLLNIPTGIYTTVITYTLVPQ